jgi:hypothetical protein
LNENPVSVHDFRAALEAFVGQKATLNTLSGEVEVRIFDVHPASAERLTVFGNGIYRLAGAPAVVSGALAIDIDRNRDQE